MKLYSINETGYIYFRPSLPDVSDSLIEKYEEYRLGYYKISTDQLLSKSYKAFWEKLYQSNEDSVQKHVNQEYLREIAKLFEDFSETTLFGLDFLYDYNNNIYYLVDCNIYPGYKELFKELNAILTEHIVKQYRKFKK
jgi:hypothetical protein